MKNQPYWIHTHDDGRGARFVMVDWKFVDKVLYADEKRGIVKVHREGRTIDILKGKVVVISAKLKRDSQPATLP